MTGAEARTDLALKLADDAEALVQQAEKAVETACGPTLRDIAETDLREALRLQDDVLGVVAPALEARERRVSAAVREAIASLQGDPAASWHAKPRRYMSAAQA